MYHHSLFSYFFVFICVSEKKARFQYLPSIIEESIAEVMTDFIKLKNYRTMSSADKFPKRSRKSFDKLSDKQKRLRQQAHYNSIIRAVECVATSSNRTIEDDKCSAATSSSVNIESASDNSFQDEAGIAT